MSKALITEDFLTNIADAIRAKLGGTDTYLPGQMASAISQIHGMPVNQRKTATKNGTVTPDMGYDGLSQVTVNVPNTYTNADEGKVVIGGALIDQTSKNITSNGQHNTTTHNSVNVNVPNKYTNADEGKVVSGGQLISQTPRQAAITTNGTYQTQNNNSVTVNVPQTGTTPTLITKAITQNGAYSANDDNADGYTGVTVNVPNTYSASDEGKVVSSGVLAAQTTKSITSNGTHSTTTNDEVVVNVPNSYSVADEGKVVDDGALVIQTSKTITENSTVDTTTNNEVVVNVQPNLQSKTVTENGTVTADSGYDGLSQVVVNVQGGVALPHILANNICARNQSHSGGILPTEKKFLLMAINSDASNETLNPDVAIKGSPATAETTEYHEYSSTGDNRRNYRINVYDVSENAGDVLSAGFTMLPAHMSWLYAYVSADFEISKVMTSAEAATSGSNSEDGCVLYGTINDNSGGTLTAADYTAGTTITTDDPGSGYKSSFIVWLTKASGDVTVEPLSVTQNGTYTAPTGKAYSPVTVNVSGGISGVIKDTAAPSSGTGNDGDIYVRNVALPNNVTFVEYLESSGTQYIDSGIVADQNTQVHVHFKTYATNPDGAVFGARASTSSRQFCVVLNKTAGNVRCDYAGSQVSPLTLTANTEYEISHGKVIYNASGIIQAYSGALPNFTTPGNMYLFAMNNNGSLSVGTGVTIYRLTIRESGVIIADFLPALDGNNTPCMYEAVSGTYKYNAGSGNFTNGSAVTPKEACTVYQKRDGAWNVLTQMGAA